MEYRVVRSKRKKNEVMNERDLKHRYYIANFDNRSKMKYINVNNFFLTK